MSHSPATPDKDGIRANASESKALLPSADKLTSTYKVKQASLTEPSPASTYGDTIAGGNSPVTPLEVGSHGKCVFLFPCLLSSIMTQSSWLGLMMIRLLLKPEISHSVRCPRCILLS